MGVGNFEYAFQHGLFISIKQAFLAGPPKILDNFCAILRSGAEPLPDPAQPAALPRTVSTWRLVVGHSSVYHGNRPWLSMVQPNWLALAGMLIRIRVTDRGQDGGFQGFHFGCLVRLLMIVPQQMQYAMDNQVGPVRLRVLALRRRLALE